MTANGVGIRFGLLAAGVTGAVGVVGALVHVPGDLVPAFVRLPVAALLAVSGLVLWLAALRAVIPAFHEGRVLTTGPYALCRHPVYGAWICLLLPGFAIARGDLVGLLATPILHFATGLLVRREERWLEQRFGENWRVYARRAPRFVPLGFARWRSS